MKYKLIYFNTSQDARDYRHVNGTGGWIFSPEDNTDSILFPPHMTPTNIFNHPAASGRSGQLIGS